MWGEERHNRDEPVILLYSILRGAPLERHKVSLEGIQGSIHWKNVQRDYEYTGDLANNGLRIPKVALKGFQRVGKDGNWDRKVNEQNSMGIKIKGMRDDLEVWS